MGTLAWQFNMNVKSPNATELTALSTTQQKKNTTDYSTVLEDILNQMTAPISSPTTAKPSKTNIVLSCKSNTDVPIIFALQVP